MGETIQQAQFPNGGEATTARLNPAVQVFDTWLTKQLTGVLGHVEDQVGPYICLSPQFEEDA